MTSPNPPSPAPGAQSAASAAEADSAAALQSTAAALRAQVAAARAAVESASAAPERAALLAAWKAAQASLVSAIGAAGPADLFAGLDAHVPLALLPIRLETRFADPGTDVLRVRIFPDDIHVDGHDPELTAAETAFGTALWAAPADLLAAGETPPATAPPPGSPAGRAALWAALVRLLGGPRAAWVARATRPGAAPPASKQQAYIRPPVARALPDRWLVRVYAGGAVIGEAWTTSVGVDLHLAPDPQAVPDTPAAGSPAPGAPAAGPVTPGPAAPAPSAQAAGQPPVDPEMRWLLDYATAVAAGMAVDVPLPAGTQAVDQVIAVGVRASESPADAAAGLAALLTAHRYTDGLGFLPAGSPTSNNPDARAVYDRRADPAVVWQQEFGPAPAAAAAGTAAARLAAALALPPGVVAGVAGGDDAGDGNAQAMQTATWAATWGYYLGQLLDPGVLSTDQVAAVRSHYLGYVRGRGTLPVLRAGRQPYGVLPVLPLDRWTADGASATADGLARLLTRTRPLWQAGAGQPVTASTGTGFDAAFSAVMSTDAVARGYTVRSVVADRTLDAVIFTGIDPAPGGGVLDAMAGALLGLTRNPLILNVFSPLSQPVRAPLVADPADPNPNAIVQAAIRGLTGTNPQLMATQGILLKPTSSGPATLLHTLLRRSLLLEYAAASLRLAVPVVVAPPVTVTPVTGGPVITPLPGTVPPVVSAAALPITGGTGTGVPVAGEPVTGAPVTSSPVTSPPVSGPAAAATSALPVGILVGLTPDPKGGFTPVTTSSGALSSAVPAVTGSMAAAEWLWRNPAQRPDSRASLDQTITALGQLGTLTADELSLLLPETLDLATHRWTAWAESLAADKLARLRGATPAGISVGGWGAVTGLTRRARTAIDPAASAGASPGPLWADTRPGGFVHAPSTAQAGTAAVLRAAHLAHGGEDDPVCAIDLSSARARMAARLADGVRAGQQLGALLGYELERDLHQRQADVLIAPLRAYAPQWQASGTFVEGAPAEIVSPSAVCDGLALAAADPAAVAAAVIPAGSPAALAAALADALAQLRGHQDALADLLTAETVQQALTANTARASAALDAMHRGGLPPADFDVLRTPRSGVSLTCRVGILLPTPAAGAQLAGGWPGSPRGTADPDCASWLAQLLPPTSAVRIRVADSQGTVTDAALPGAAGLGPLDIVVDSADITTTRIQLALPAGSTLVSGRDPAWTPDTVSLAELLTVTADLNEVVTVRALRAADLLPDNTTPGTATSGTATPGTATPGAADERDTADLSARLTAARAGLTTAAATVASATSLLQAAAAPDGTGTAAARAAIGTALSYGVILHVPPGPSADDLLTALDSAAAELQRRLALPAPAATATADDLVSALKGLLGSGQPAVPRLLVDAGLAAVAGPGLQAGDGYLAAAPELAADWLADVAGARGGAGRLAAAVQDCEALAAADGLTDTWRIVESTRGATAWTATLGAAELAAAGPATAVVLRAGQSAGFTAGSPVAGLVCDEWTEVVPQQVAATSVAYQAEAPTARAPQVILLGVAPDTAAGWDTETVTDLVREALSLAQLRAVDLEKGAWLGRMLPAVLLPDGDAADVIAAPPLPLLQVDPALLAKARLDVKGLG